MQRPKTCDQASRRGRSPLRMAGSLLAHHVPHVHPLPPLQEEAWPCALGLGQALAKQHCSNLSVLVLANDDDQKMKYRIRPSRRWSCRICNSLIKCFRDKHQPGVVHCPVCCHPTCPGHLIALTASSCQLPAASCQLS